MSGFKHLKMRFALALGAAMVFTPVRSAVDGSGRPPLEKVADVPLPGRPTRWDYASVDPARHLLFLAHLGDSEVVVFDTRIAKVVAAVRDVDDVHGVLVVPRLGRVYASATGTNELVVIDENALKIIARVPAGNYPDGIAYAPGADKLFVSDESGGSDTVIEATTHRRIATIPLGGEVGNTQYDPVSGHIFVNVQTRNELAEIDPLSDRLIARYPLPGARGSHGLLIDPANRLAFIACEGNHKLLVFNMRTMKVTAAFPVGRAPDVLAFDSYLGLLYVASESGMVALFKVRNGAVNMLGEGWLGPNAHSVVVDSSTHKAYFPLKAWQGIPVLRIMQPQHSDEGVDANF